jgi:hypothetical protein
VTFGHPAGRLPANWRERTDWLPPDSVLGRRLRWLRRLAVAGYLVTAIVYALVIGLPFDRNALLLWIAVGLLACCIGKHPIWLLWVAVDFVPLALVLIAYDLLRGLSDTIGMPTWWHPQLDADKFMFGGTDPTVWLQEHLERVHTQWYDVVVAVCYFSFFFLPYLLAGVLWLRSRAAFYRWMVRFVALSFLGFAVFVLVPAAPPWAAARCGAAQVAHHPNNPPCMYLYDPNGGLLGRFGTHHAGVPPVVQLITTRGFDRVHLGAARALVDEGREVIDNVAAVPSLHVGGTVLFVLFMWRRVNRYWQVLLVGYPILMMFSLAYGGDHYVTDGIAGALCAWFVHWGIGRLERRRCRRPAATTLGAVPDPVPTGQPQEIECPSSRPQPATTPSST